jgi:hypothetical protein
VPADVIAIHHEKVQQPKRSVDQKPPRVVASIPCLPDLLPLQPLTLEKDNHKDGCKEHHPQKDGTEHAWPHGHGGSCWVHARFMLLPDSTFSQKFVVNDVSTTFKALHERFQPTSPQPCCGTLRLPAGSRRGPGSRSHRQYLYAKTGTSVRQPYIPLAKQRDSRISKRLLTHPDGAECCSSSDRVVTYEGFLVPTGSGTQISVPTGPNFGPRDARGPREFRRNILWDGTTVPAGVGSTKKFFSKRATTR